MKLIWIDRIIIKEHCWPRTLTEPVEKGVTTYYYYYPVEAVPLEPYENPINALKRQVSISSTFYAQIFCMNIFSAAFL